MSRKWACAALAFMLSSNQLYAADIVADSVSEPFTPPLNGGGACPADVTVLSDGDFSRPGYCPRLPIPAGYFITFTFSPTADERTTGIRIWSNAGSNYRDAELREFDLEVDYVDAGGNPQTLVLDNVNIGDTLNRDDAKFVSFASGDPDGLLQATEIRMSDFKARTGDFRLEFREVNAVVVSPPTVILSAGPTAPGAPVTVTATFSEDVTGVDLSDFQLTDATASNLVQISPSVYQFTATPTPSATNVSVSVPANAVTDVAEGTPNLASGTLDITVSASLPPTDETALLDTIRGEELKTLRQSLDRAQSRSRSARDRLALDMRCRDIDTRDDATPEEFLECDRYRNSLNQPLVTQGEAEAGLESVMVNGMVTKQVANADGTRRRLFIGTFDVTHDNDLGTIATLSGEMAWERITRPTTLFGYFVGAELSFSDVQGTYTGDRQRLGVSGGIYGVQAMDNGLLADGFAVLGFGLNTLDLSDGTVDLEADYTAPTVLLGGALSGERPYAHYTLHPEIALAVGYTDIGNVDYDAGSGPAEADAGYAALARLRLTPEVRIPWTPGHASYDLGSIDFEPSVICEWVDAGDESSDCGVGFGIEVTAQSTNGLHQLSGRVGIESIGGTERSSLTLALESRF